jgi:hypothetical protein
MLLNIFSKKTILFQIFCGLVFTVVANPILLYDTYGKFSYYKVIMYFHTMVMTMLLLRAIIRFSINDYNKAIKKGFFKYFKNYFTIFWASAFEFLLVSYLFSKFILKIDINSSTYLITPIIIAFIVIELFSFYVRNSRSGAIGRRSGNRVK